ncbi:MAG: GGDEF domain-containing protein, partial [Thermoanaerobaculia bacterium]|nr:GGDEF domain-containing protein [Thermoanaerobaculia bacterium]
GTAGGGLQRFDPESERPDPRGNLVVREVSLNRELVDPRPRYDLSPDQSSIGVEVRLIDLDGGDRALYRSQLIGIEDEPGAWTPNRRFEFAGLSAGDYTLLIEAMDDQGRIYEPVEIAFSIAKPLWATWWAILSYILLAMLFIGFAVHLRVRYLQRRTVELERLVQSRTRDLERSNRELEAANRSLSAMTETDPLTGAKNRRWFSLHFPMEADRVLQSSRRTDDLLIVLVDIDHFKTVNDRFGHAVGDQVLVRFKDVLGRTVRESDTLIRWGGEEFLIVARKTSREEAPIIANRIVEEVRSEPFETEDGRTLQLTTSVGVVPFPFDPDERSLVSWDEVIGLTDLCLYTVKNSGRDGWVALFPGERGVTAELFQRMKEEPEMMVESGAVRVESSFGDADRLSWPTPVESGNGER